MAEVKIYQMEKMPKSTCPACEEKVDWLRPEFDEMTDDDPSFFICFKCGFVGQVGVGSVEKISEVG